MTGYERILRDQGVVPLRTILRNFLNLVECCEESVNDGNDSYEKEFQELKQFSENLKSDTAYRCKEGEKTVNRKKNRYKDIVPFDYTRVILGDYGEVQGSDYINANFIKGASGSSAYIACQGPLPHTVNDFWRMVVECEVQVIVMACNEQESGKHKCENYWVEEEAVERQFGDVTIWLKKCRQVCPDFLVRTMKIRYTTPGGEIEERNVCQFHYSAWPDHGVPSKVRPLLDMVRLIRDFQTSETLPVLVHCSAGCGRTGTICAIDYVWGLLRLGKLTAEFSLFHLVSEMRRQRIAMVQTKDQYVLVHRAVKELFEEQLKIIDSHPYANVDVNGLPLDIKSDLLEEPTYETVEFHSNENKSENKQHIRSPSSTSSAVPPPLPPVFRDQASGSSRTEKDSDYSFKSQEEEKLNSATPSSRSYSAYKNIDDITVISSDTEDKVDKEKESFGHKSNSKASPIRNALLRKPSIVKLKAFFEKSKDDKKSGTTNLSRAKSDVSSRFYSFNKTFTSRGPSALTKNKSSSSTSSPPSDENITSKPKTKPALLAKPILPVKRSKSLKVGKEDENADPREAFKVSLANKAKNSTAQRENSIEKEITLNSEPHNIVSLQASSSSSNTMTVTNNPIRVCIKQVDIPQLQTAVAKSIRPEPQTATTHELRRKSIINEQEIIERSIKSKNNFEEHKYAPLTKPAIPPKSHIVLKGGGNHSYSNVAVSPSRIKMGIAKEMEDVVDSGPKSSKYGKLKKYGTVTPKSLAASINSKTSLTRSQSHVWQGNKIQLPVRIFSDENIHQTSNMHERSFPLPNTTTSKSSSMLFSKSNGEKSEHKPNEFLSDKVQDVLLDNKSMQKSFDYQMDIDRSREKPIAQRRVPKTNPYANYFPSVGSTKLLLGCQASSASQQPDSPISSTSVPQIYSMENGNRDLPQLKISYSRSRENSSESSSNTATPRSSLPGTPTQTVDPTYTQLIKSNLQGLSNNGNYGKVNNNNGNPPPKSILKGSLSSTPSESDERLDSSRPSPSTPLIIKPNVITAPQKISTVRIAVGVRERRNSFRQAVWKEEDSSHNGHNNSDVQKSPSNPFLFQNGNKTTEVSNSNSRPMLAKYPPGIHKDYEPIWPEFGNSNKNNNYPNTTGSTSFYVSNGDQYNALPNVNSNVNSAPYSSGNGNLTPIQPHHISSQISKRSRSEERTIDSTSNNRPGFQSRYDEIKVLLDELKAPNNNFTNSTMSNTNSISNPSPIPNRVRREMDSSTASGKPSSTNLKHQRSLRTPTRPQYQQGLSCFTFRKPASFESITDQIYFEENPPINSQLSQSRPYGASSNFSKENGNHVVHQNYPLQNRNTNDYVSLRQCRSSAEREVPVQNHSKDLFHNRGQSFNSIGDNSVPVAPPRTKKLQQQENARREQVQSGNSSSSNKVSECGPSTSLSVWVSSNGERVENSNLPEIVRCTNSNTNHSSEDNQVSSDSQNNLNPTSPKAIIRALGLFQAKAANMRSRFANWTETKDKSNAERSNGAPHLLSAKENDQKDDNNDGGFTSSVTSANQLPHPSRSKHQYL